MVNLILFVASLSSAAVSTSDRALVERGDNLLKNGGFEAGKAQWTASAGTFATTTTAANVGKGSVAATWDAAASGNTLTSTAVAIPAGLYGRNGVVSCLIQGASATHTLQAYDGTNILASQTISSQAGYTRTSVNFIYPSSGNISLRLYANADEPSIAIDDCFLGDADGYNISQIAQAQFVGAVKVTACTSAWSTTSASYANFSTQTNCSYSTSGNALAPSTNVPGIRFASLPPGEYMLVYEGLVVKDGSINTIGLRFNDGTNSSREESFYKNNAGSNDGGQSGFTQSINYSTSQSNITLQIQAKVSANNGYIHGTTANPGVIRVYRFPSSSEQALNINNQPASGSVKYAGITNCLWTGTTGSYTSFGADADCNTATGTGNGSYSGSKIPAGTFSNVPAGSYLVVANGLINTIYASSSTECAYRLWDGTNQIASIAQSAYSGASSVYAQSISGVVTYTSQASRTIELQYFRTSGGGSCQIVNNGTSVEFQIMLIPLSQSSPAPLLVGSVTSNSSGQERIERVTFGGSTPFASNCTSTPCTIHSQSGSWLSSVSRSGTGAYTLNINSGIFASAPTCTIMSINYGTAATFGVIDGLFSATSAPVKTVNVSGTGTDSLVNIICQGPRGI